MEAMRAFQRPLKESLSSESELNRAGTSCLEVTTVEDVKVVAKEVKF